MGHAIHGLFPPKENRHERIEFFDSGVDDLHVALLHNFKRVQRAQMPLLHTYSATSGKGGISI